MELVRNEEEGDDNNNMAVPLNSRYSGGHGHVMNHIVPSSTNGPTVDSSSHLVPNMKKNVKYRECLKNHAASMGGNAVDGCGEFMASGEEGTIEALNCSVCNCHRNFHRKEIQGGEPSSCFDIHNNNGYSSKVFMGGHNNNGLGLQGYHQYHHHRHLQYPSRPAVPHPMIMSYNNNNNIIGSESDEQEEGGVGVRPAQNQMVKKRFRTKFTQEQKEKMFNFAEKVGWKIQKQEEGVVQQLCQELGLKRRVLKVWMHNNKHTLAKKNTINNHQSNSNVDQNHQLQNND